MATLIDDETTVLLLADNALGPKILHGTFSALSALHALDLSANRFEDLDPYILPVRYFLPLSMIQAGMGVVVVVIVVVHKPMNTETECLKWL